ncbi:Rieske 2Fe-2S family protein [Methylobacterium sp. PvP062]|uniref:Rieske (2Fe-2S) domain protein n=2 Tax=Methylobacterium radiotolerans TaxID=31998 RepID=B1LZY8_METRJ|nr:MULTISPECIES: aromatic ring-hydroxylating dioxygenase subunit alpha [Methylobacterium]MCX7335709.1 aromatic ring-hydroxylating dioxygenase subunit alpha [Hyphomicrobiales bacterium]ACB24471.1 Rieske (2Fe-2S) domain protein [Methylobacterium radiotolerans JCM 2831]MBP2495433.1 Rieske 2Fe-2S family protein [Methylobacterium sp. PvP105]MBP2504696.1 Rieske 2Fe-2S family protein [Methylobacterium sp. PvP109]RUP21478.1 MAG: aromatic ring-hydroxylating dioxygenase subunit alpha [Methylobacterium s
MLDVTPTPLQRLLRERRRGYSLPAEFYLSPEIFDADMAVIFGRHWIYVGVEPDVPEAGDVMVVDIGTTSVAIVRDDDGAVRAFHNVCRHRGARLVHEEKSTVGNLVCRYHSWTYDLTGALIHADHMGPDFRRGCHGLKPVHIRSLEGLLFVCLSDDPPADFDAMAARLGPYIAPHNIRDTKVAFQKDIVEPGNWKLTMENNRECYHCGANHPELTVPLFAYGFGFAPEEMDEHDRAQAERYGSLLRTRHGEWEAEGLPSKEIDELDTMITGFRTERLPLDGEGESHTIDTKAACRKLLGSLTNAKLGGLSVWTQPNSWHHFLGDHIVTFSVLPLDTERSLLRTKWLVHKDAVEGVDYDLANLTGVWEATNDQDSELVGICQQGVRSPAYEPGPYSPHTEMLVEKFCTWYVGRMAAHLGR